MVPRRLLAPLAAAAAALGALPAATSAAADGLVKHVSFETTEPAASADGAIVPGELIGLRHVVRNDGAPMTGVTGWIRSSTAGLRFVETQRTSPYPAMATGGTAQNTSPYQFTAGGTCGDTLGFTVLLSSAGERDDEVTFPVQTGARGPLRWYPTQQPSPPPPPVQLADAGTQPGVTELELPVDPGGLSAPRTKDVEVAIPSLTHGRLSDLKVELVDPQGTRVVLVDGLPGTRTAMTGTVFAADGVPQSEADTQLTGRVRPVGDLGEFEGKRLLGTWKLVVTDTVAGQAGAMDAWRLGASRAICKGIPVADISANPGTTTPGGTVVFDATDSQDDVKVTRYDWDLDGDGTFELLNGGPIVERAYPVKGTYHVTVRAWDAEDLSDTATFRLPVTTPPTASFTAPAAAMSLDEVVLDASTSSDADGTIVRYEWDLDGNGVVETDGGTNPVLRHRFPSPGRIAIGLRVTDENGATAEATTQDIVIGNRDPVAKIAGPVVAPTGSLVTYSAAGSTDEDGEVVLYEWDFTGDHVKDATTSTPTVQHAFAARGVRTVHVRAVDGNGGRSVEAGLEVRVHAPPAIVVTSTPTAPLTGEAITFDASGTTDPDGSAMTFAWDINGDGTFELDTAGTPTTTRAFPHAGYVRIGVRATDADGGVSVSTHQVLVSAPAPPPTDPGTGGTTGGGGTGTTSGDVAVAPGPAPLDAGATTIAGVPAAPGAAPAGEGVATANGPLAVQSYTARLGGSAIQRMRTVRRSGVKLSCESSSGGQCVVEVFLRKGRRTIRLGRASALLTSGRREAVYLKLGAVARRALPRRGDARLVVRGFARDGIGRRVELRRTVLVRR